MAQLVNNPKTLKRLLAGKNVADEQLLEMTLNPAFMATLDRDALLRVVAALSYHVDNAIEDRYDRMFNG